MMRFLFKNVLLVAGLFFIVPMLVPMIPSALGEERPSDALERRSEALERRIEQLKQIELERQRREFEPGEPIEYESEQGQVERLEQIERVKQQSRKRIEQLEELEERVRDQRKAERSVRRRKVETEKPRDPSAFRFVNVYGGIGRGEDGDIRVENADGVEVDLRLDLKARTGNDAYDPSPNFFAAAGGEGRTIRKPGHDGWLTIRWLNEIRIIRAGDYKGTVGDNLVEATITSLGVAPMLELLLGNHFSLYGGPGISLSLIDATYIENNRETSGRGFDFYGVAGTRLYSAPPGKRGLFLDIRGELIFPQDKYWGRQGYAGLGIGVVF